MQAVTVAEERRGPDLDEVTEEVVKALTKARVDIDIESLKPLRAIGAGGQGGVWLALDQSSGCRLAVKQIRKGRLALLPQVSMERALTERECLLEVGDHPFITTCFGCFQNASSLFFALELAPAGDLFGALDHHPDGLPEPRARFYCACIALALRHVHAHGWVYRDIKLENVLIRADGYVQLCDFGLAKKATEDRTYTTCGTDEYAPPEALSGEGRSSAADWWALGVLLHEMLTSRPPFEGGSAESVLLAIIEYAGGGKIAANQLHMQTAAQVSLDCANFLMGLLQAKEADRIGAGPTGFLQIQNHPWFEDLDWEATLRRQAAAPWVPPREADGAVDMGLDFEVEDVMLDRPYEPHLFPDTFKAFGPTRVTPWPGDK